MPKIPNEWAAAQPRGMPTRSVLEGPSFDRDGNLWCVDIPNGRIFVVSPDGRFELVTEYDGWPNGLRIARDGRILIADFRNGIMELDPKSGKVSPVVVRHGVEHFKAVNDLTFASNGDLYFTDQGATGYQDSSGRLFKLSAAGKVTCILNNIPGPNGLVLNADETQVYVASTRGNCVWKVPLNADESPIKVGTFIQLSGGGGPDGLALTEAGGLAIAHVGLGSVWIFSSTGEPVYRVRSCEGPFTTNIAFGGPDRRTLYITEGASQTILAADLPIAGRKLYSHQD